VETTNKARHEKTVKSALASKTDLPAQAASAAKVKAARAIKATKGRKEDFDPAEFLAKIGAGRTIVEVQKGESIFAQGEVATAVFYVQKGRIRISVISKAGKEATVALLGTGNFLGEECIAAPKGTTPGDRHRPGNLHHSQD
jgi:CRP-like cAMP-binding protein